MRENKEARGERTLRLVEEQPIVKISGLSKAFGEKKVLDNIDLEIPQGKIIGLLGPNGSGKTTLIKILSGFCADYEGEVLIDGKRPGSAAGKAKVAYLPDKDGLPENLPADEIIKIYDTFFDDFDEERCRRLLDIFGIDEKTVEGELSKGEADKLKISLLMSRDARLYLLDEPIGGIDVEARQHVLDLILENFNPCGSMIIVTHLVRDIERLFDSVIILKDGKTTMYDDSDAIRECYGGTLEEAVISIFRGEEI